CGRRWRPGHRAGLLHSWPQRCSRRLDARLGEVWTFAGDLAESTPGSELVAAREKLSGPGNFVHPSRASKRSFAGDATRLAVVLLVTLCGIALGLDWEPGRGYRSAALATGRAGKPGFTRLDPAVTGITFSNHLAHAAAADNRILENGSGVALGDVDGDGWCDIYFCRLEGANMLYRNLGNWKFEDITSKAGVACPDQYSTGAVFADVDGDGDLDLLVNAIGGGTRLFLT